MILQTGHLKKFNCSFCTKIWICLELFEVGTDQCWCRTSDQVESEGWMDPIKIQMREGFIEMDVRAATNVAISWTCQLTLQMMDVEAFLRHL